MLRLSRRRREDQEEKEGSLEVWLESKLDFAILGSSKVSEHYS